MFLQNWTIHEAKTSYLVIDREAKVEEYSSDLHREEEIKLDLPCYNPEGIPFMDKRKYIHGNPNALESFNSE